MGTYTTNYQLYMPTIGETGWGTLVNENYQTIDSTMKGLSNRITAVENEVNGNLSCTTVTTSGKVTANGGISTKALTGTTGTFSGAVTGASFNNVILKTGVLTVTPTSGTFYIPGHNESYDSEIYHGSLTVLPLQPNIAYTGSVKFRNNFTSDRVLVYYNSNQVGGYRVILPANSDYTLTFSNIKYLVVATTETNNNVAMYNFTIS